MNFNDTTSIFVKDLFRLRKVGSKPKDESMDNSVFHRQPVVDETGIFGLPSSIFRLRSSIFDLRSSVFGFRSSVFSRHPPKNSGLRDRRLPSSVFRLQTFLLTVYFHKFGSITL